jgi:hypothetical protein
MQKLLKINFALLILFCSVTLSCSNEPKEVLTPEYNLYFNMLSTTWDEAIPLGNGMLGALVWQKGGLLKLRNPFPGGKVKCNTQFTEKDGIIEVNTRQNQRIAFEPVSN